MADQADQPDSDESQEQEEVKEDQATAKESSNIPSPPFNSLL